MSSDCLLIAAWTPRSITIGATAILLVLLAGVVLYFFRIRKRSAKPLSTSADGVGGAVRRSWTNLTGHPFAKYVIFSVIAHIVLVIWACTARFLDVPRLPPGPRAVVVELGEVWANDVDDETKPWDQPPMHPAPVPPPELAAEPNERPDPIDRPQSLAPDDVGTESALEDLDSVVSDEPAPQPKPRTLQPKPLAVPTNIAAAKLEADATSLASSPPLADSPHPNSSAPRSQQPPTLNEQPTPQEVAQAVSRDHDEVAAMAKAAPEPEQKPLSEPSKPMPTASSLVAQPLQPLQPLNKRWGEGARLPIRKTAGSRRSDGRQVPAIYRDRLAADRLAIAQARGGSQDTEAAVRLALEWLALNQSADGQWDASRFGSGRPTNEGGQDRQNAGINADTGITGLAILAFLGAGHTHVDGQHQQTVRHGIEYLLRGQRRRADGALVGSAGGFAAMYCHGIATLALSECYALTGDANLLTPLRRAIAFSLAAQHPVTGGWRYRPQEPGDTSQLGWQLMALTSAHYGGIQIPRTSWTGAGRFLNSVAWGRHGGLASYRPGERPTTTMTAEALLCRLFLGVPPTHPLVNEAADYLMSDLPGSGRINLYYWYYGTLALFQLQDERWTQWNSAVKRELVRRQRTGSSLAGSWDADTVWGGSGGRVYTTALATLTLEVYYRYRPRTRSPSNVREPEQTAWIRD